MIWNVYTAARGGRAYSPHIDHLVFRIDDTELVSLGGGVKFNAHDRDREGHFARKHFDFSALLEFYK